MQTGKAPNEREHSAQKNTRNTTDNTSAVDRAHRPSVAPSHENAAEHAHDGRIQERAPQQRREQLGHTDRFERAATSDEREARNNRGGQAVRPARAARLVQAARATGPSAGRASQTAREGSADHLHPAHPAGNAHGVNAHGTNARSTSTNGTKAQSGQNATIRPRPQKSARRTTAQRNNATQSSTASTRPKSRYIPALDGIRTLAVAAVVLYHLNLTWAQGGMSGVTMFFVLSGFLITHLLLNEFDKTGRIDLKDFWMRRIRRLVPAILTVIVATAALCTVFNHVMLTKMRPDIAPSLLFFNNWWQILHNVSYFNALGDPSPLTHFWSLAIEEQFYLVWPLILLGALMLGIKRVYIRRATLVLAAASALVMALLYNPAVDPSRIYYGTDTRMFSLLLGAWLAFIPESSLTPAAIFAALRKLFKRKKTQAGVAEEHQAGNAADPGGATAAPSLPRPLAQAPLDVLGVIGLIGLLALIAFTNGYTSFQYLGGTLLCSLFALALTAACIRPESLLARFFALKPLVWVGQRSYSIYLWHYPLLLLMNPTSDINATPWWMMILQVAIVVAIAALCYRFIETPFRHGAFGRFLAMLRTGAQQSDALAAAARRHIIPLAAGLAVTLVAVGGLAFVPDTSALSAEGAQLLQGDGGSDTSADDKGTGANSQGDTNGTSADAPKANDNTEDADGDGFPEGSYDIIMVGDSVSLRAVPEFQATFPHGYIDAAKSRQFSAGMEAYTSYVQQNLAGKIAVFALGTNGLVTDDQIDSLMQQVGEKRIAVFITTRSPQPWVGATNDAINRAAERYKNVRVIDWYGYSAGRNDLFDGDGTHLSANGAKEYIKLVYDTVKADLPVHPEDHSNDAPVVAAKTAVEDFAKSLAPKPHALNSTEEK